MKAAICPLILLLAASAAAPAGAAETPEALAAWMAATVKPLDWMFVGRSTVQGLAIYAKPAPDATDPELKRIWARYEHHQPVTVRGMPVKSAVSLQEFDCEQRQGHSLESTFYRDNNLAGPSQKMPEEDWSIAAPGSAFEVLMHRACGDEQE
jgi:hypothetical protein